MRRPGRWAVAGAAVVAAGAAVAGCAPAGGTTAPPPATSPPPATPSSPSSASASASASVPAAAPDGVEVLRLAQPGGGGAREVWVSRPRGVADSAELPVLYLLHGYPGSPAAVFGSLDLDGSARQVARTGGRPFVLVVPDGGHTRHADSEWADSVDGADRLETFLVSTVIPAVEGAHRRDAAHRAIAGFSMGGYGAMNLALRHPDLFGQVASMAGYFHVDDPDGVFGGDPAVEAANSPDRHAAAARGLRVLLTEGADDGLPLVHGEAQRFAGLLRAAGVPVTVRIVPDLGHTAEFVRAEFPAVVTFLDAGWPR